MDIQRPVRGEDHYVTTLQIFNRRPFNRLHGISRKLSQWLCNKDHSMPADERFFPDWMNQGGKIPPTLGKSIEFNFCKANRLCGWFVEYPVDNSPFDV